METRIRTDITDEEIDAAILKHCFNSAKQVEEIVGGCMDTETFYSDIKKYEQ